MSDPRPITFDTGNPLEGHGAPLPSKHGGGRSAGAGALTNPDDYSAAEGGGLEPTIRWHELRVPMNCTLRPISPTDETALIQFHDRCSETTHYLRFAAAKPQLRPAEAHHLCGVDDHCRGALVIIESDDPGTIHGVGRWERVSVTEAELAFVIEDAYQARGLGRKLIEATIERARGEGFTRLVTDVLSSNYRMRRLARDYDLVIADL